MANFMYDALGNRVDAKALKEPQTAAIATLHREFDKHPTRGLTPAALAQILERAEQGDLTAQSELFQDMEERDCHIQSELGKRKMAVTQLDWSLVALEDGTDAETKAVKDLESRIRDLIDPDDLFFDCLDAIGHGYSCLELEWKKGGNGWFPNIQHRPPTWFTIDPKQRNELRLRDNASPYGQALMPFGWITHVHKSRSGWLPRIGLHRALAWPYLFKQYSVRDLAELLEIYGLPIRLGKYPVGATKEDKATLMQAVLAIGHHAGGIIPQGMEMDFITATSSGSSDPFKALIDWCESSQSKAILGGTLTSQTGANGNRALGDIHNEVRLDIRNSDARQLGVTLSRFLLYPLCVLNGLVAEDRCPDWVFDTQEPDDLGMYSDAIPKLVAVGLKIPAKYIYGKLKIPEPEGDEAVLEAPAAPAMPAGMPNGAPQDTQGALPPKPPKTAATSAASPADDPDPSPVTLYTEQLAADNADHLKAMLDTIHQAALTAPSLEALRDQLLVMYGDLPSEQLTEAMAIAFATANLAGMGDVANEASA